MAAIKIVLTGDIATGKTSFIKQFAEGVFETEKTPTICDSLSRTLIVDGKEKIVELWDTAGQERFRTVTSSFYKGARVVAFVFDLSRKDTFDNLQHWISEVDRCASETAEKILIGNKSDLENREVESDEAKALAEEIGLPYYETSAKTGANIESTITDAIKFIESEELDTVAVNNKRIVTNQATDKKKSHCVLL